MIVSAVDFLTKDVDLPVECDSGQGLFDHDGHVVAAERFCQEIECAKPHGDHGGIAIAEIGHDDDEGFAVGCVYFFFGVPLAVRIAFYPFHDIQTGIQTGQNRQVQVQEDEIKASLFNQTQRIPTIIGCDRFMPILVTRPSSPRRISRSFSTIRILVRIMPFLLECSPKESCFPLKARPCVETRQADWGKVEAALELYL